MPTPLQLANRRKLVQALRAMPPDFEWNFNTYYITRPEPECKTIGCAWGLAKRIGLVTDTCFDEIQAEEVFGLKWDGEDGSAQLFFNPGLYSFYGFNDITPEMVADQLESLDD